MSHMKPTPDDRLWKALADPSRREILELLRRQPRTTGDLCGKFGRLSRFAVMKHLKQLERVALVTSKRDGKFRWNYLNPSPLRKLEHGWFGRYRRQESR